MTVDEPDHAPLNREPFARFLSHLEAVRSGAVTPQSVRESFRPDISDGYCIYNLNDQFRQAFAYEPGRWEALAPITTLARKALEYQYDDTYRLFTEPEWRRLVDMRGPVEAVAWRTCRSCGQERVDFYLSGFTDEFSAVCRACGDVLFQSIWDDRPLPRCACGGAYDRNDACARCGSTDADVTQRSSYEYFATHSWIRR